MSNDDRRLCLDYLVWCYGVSMSEAKLEYGRAPSEERRKLLTVATEWDKRGRVPGLVASHPPPVSAPHKEKPVTAPKVAVANRAGSDRPARQKKVMFSILLPPSDLESLRSLSDRSGETVAYHVRTAIKRYLKSVEGEGL